MNNKDVIERIRKLLALAEGGSGPEAELALVRANEMILKYNISLRDVNGKSIHTPPLTEQKFSEERWPLNGELGVIEYWASCLVRNHFFVEIFVRRDKNSAPECIRFLGEPHNVTIAMYVMKLLVRTFSDLWDNHHRRTGCDKSHINSYMSGLYYGLDRKLSADRNRAFSDSRALAEVKSELTKYCNSVVEAANVTYGTNYMAGAKKDANARSMGEKAGAKIEIFAAVDGGRKQPPLRKKIA